MGIFFSRRSQILVFTKAIGVVFRVPLNEGKAELGVRSIRREIGGRPERGRGVAGTTGGADGSGVDTPQILDVVKGQVHVRRFKSFS